MQSHLISGTLPLFLKPTVSSIEQFGCLKCKTSAQTNLLHQPLMNENLKFRGLSQSFSWEIFSSLISGANEPSGSMRCSELEDVGWAHPPMFTGVHVEHVTRALRSYVVQIVLLDEPVSSAKPGPLGLTWHCQFIVQRMKH